MLTFQEEKPRWTFKIQEISIRRKQQQHKVTFYSRYELSIPEDCIEERKLSALQLESIGK